MATVTGPDGREFVELNSQVLDYYRREGYPVVDAEAAVDAVEAPVVENTADPDAPPSFE